jgi:hypothetical protein
MESIPAVFVTGSTVSRINVSVQNGQSASVVTSPQPHEQNVDAIAAIPGLGIQVLCQGSGSMSLPAFLYRSQYPVFQMDSPPRQQLAGDTGQRGYSPANGKRADKNREPHGNCQGNTPKNNLTDWEALRTYFRHLVFFVKASFRSLKEPQFRFYHLLS